MLQLRRHTVVLLTTTVCAVLLLIHQQDSLGTVLANAFAEHKCHASPCDCAADYHHGTIEIRAECETHKCLSSDLCGIVGANVTGAGSIASQPWNAEIHACLSLQDGVPRFMQRAMNALSIRMPDICLVATGNVTHHAADLQLATCDVSIGEHGCACEICDSDTSSIRFDCSAMDLSRGKLPNGLHLPKLEHCISLMPE